MARRHRGTFGYLGNFTYHVPGAGGIFALLLWLLAGALVGNIIMLAMVKLLGEGVTECATIVSYVVMFIPPMLYSSSKSRVNSMNCKGYTLDSDKHIKPLGWAVAVPVVMAGTLALSYCSEQAGAWLPDMPEWLEEALGNLTQGALWLDFICVSICAPIFEEWLCRGMVLRGLLCRKVSPVWAIIISGLFFALIHMNPWQAIPAFLLGCLFGYVYYRTGSLKLTMLMHFTNNTFALILSNIDSIKEADTFQEILPGTAYWTVFAACVIIVVLTVLAFRRIPVEGGNCNCDEVPSLFEERDA